MTDKIFETWLAKQNEEAMALAAASDVVSLVPEPGRVPARRFVAHFRAPTMVRAGGEVSRADGFTAFFQFPPEYLRSVPDAAQIVNLLEPEACFHPNVAAPFICTGHVAPGTGLVELVFQVYEILTFQKITPREDDALNREACAWARRQAHLFPLSSAPLRGRTVAFAVEEIVRDNAGELR